MMKIPRFFRHRKLWAATARRSSAASAGMDFEEMPEPNMKLSRALLIVLLLHVVAVSGIIAFNAIKTRESSFVAASSANTEPHPPAPQTSPSTRSKRGRVRLFRRPRQTRNLNRPRRRAQQFTLMERDPKRQW